MIELKRMLAVATVLFGAVIAMDAGAEPSGGPPKGEAAHGKDHGKAAAGKAGEGKLEAAKEKDKDKDKDKDEDKDKDKDKDKEALPAGRPHSELRELRDELKAGKLKKADLEGRLTKLQETNKERQDNHRAALKARWGEQLAKPDAQQELSVHERRMAKLDRLLLLAQMERTGKAAEKLSGRIEKLIDLETARHEKRMAAVTAGAAAAQPTPAQPAAVNNEVAK
jgi:hypothetical protein